MTTETIVLGDELERLADRYDEVAAMEADADDSASGQAVRWSLNELDQQGAAVGVLVEEYGPNATVEVRGLTAGEYGRVEDRVEKIRQQRDLPSVQGAHRTLYAAMGLVSAPFLDDDVDTWDGRVDVVSGVNPATAKWLYARVDAATTPGEGASGNWKPSDG